MPYYYINGRKTVRSEQFINFWSKIFNDPNAKQYQNNIRWLSPKLKPREISQKLRNLFKWKNQRRLSEGKRTSVEINFVQRITELTRLKATPKEFLAKFNKGGETFRIFFLHCWRPNKYPIFDVNAYRAMMFIKNGQINELGQAGRINIYLEDYIPFIETIRKNNPALSLKTIDEGLFVFGKFLKAYPTVFDD